MGAAPVPVPPPMPAVINTMSVALQGLGNLGAALLRGLAAHLGVGAGALALGQLFPDLNFIGLRWR